MIEHDDLPKTSCASGLLAATVALMTRYADPALEESSNAGELRALLARKIVANLSSLRHHPSLPPGFRQVMARLHEQWAAISREPLPAPNWADVAAVH